MSVVVFYFWGICLCVGGSACALINEFLVRTSPRDSALLLNASPTHRGCAAHGAPHMIRARTRRIAIGFGAPRCRALETNMGPLSPSNELSRAPRVKLCYASPFRRQRAARATVFIASRIASPLHRPSCSAAQCSECQFGPLLPSKQ